MDSGIEFGEVQHQKPDEALRPDEDPRMCVIPVGEIDPDNLPIFVELDVMRDMEGHARTNTNVELGGVMLGHQFHDKDDRPFVLVTDCLRAEHYEATKGSFKFTHETWQTISRQRDLYPEGVQMVGWYHTHPDWGVFLSGMDLFICDNFFNRPLDVALVIDPCRDDRGWFQWNVDKPNETQRTAGFFLYASRFRQNELEYFSNLYQGTVTMAADPRYNQMAYPSGGNSTINLNDQRTPVQNIAIMAMLTMQMIVLSVIAWKMMSPTTANSDKIDKIENSVAALADGRNQQARDEAYQAILNKMTEGKTDKKDFATLLSDATEKSQNRQTQLEAQTQYSTLLKRDKSKLNSDLSALKSKYSTARKTITAKNKKIDALEKEKGKKSNILWIAGGGFLLILLGGIGGYLARHYTQIGDELEDSEATDEYPNENQENSQDVISFGQSSEVTDEEEAPETENPEQPHE